MKARIFFLFIFPFFLAWGALAATEVGVCSRTKGVRDEIMRQVQKTDCTLVTREDLRKITRLIFKRKVPRGISLRDRLRGNPDRFMTLRQGLKSGDFEGLSSLVFLKIRRTLGSSTLPEDIFKGLTSLKVLILGSNRLTTLPAGIFAGLPSLKWLDLQDNQFTSLPATIFEGLSSLEWLNLGGNNFNSLPETIEELPSLKWPFLWPYKNSL